MRRIAYITGTRADFGLMRRTLLAVDAHPDLDLSIVVTGMHLSARFGNTVTDIQASGLPIGTCVPVDIDDDTEAAATRAVAQFAAGLAAHLAVERPDMILLLGDRWEMLTAALVATVAGIPIVHLCGGERSGTIDDALRHAISKLAHVHLVALDEARERLERMGEEPSRIHVVGTPGLVGMLEDATLSRDEIARRFELTQSAPLALMLFHPVVQDADLAGDQARTLLESLADAGFQAICLRPNADLGNSAISGAMERFCSTHPRFTLRTHFERAEYLSMLASADLLIGNSSSGIIEAASFGIPVVNAGDRQSGRTRNLNVIDAPIEREALRSAIAAAQAAGRQSYANIYGDGKTDLKVTDLLTTLPLDRALHKKANTY